MHASVEFCPNCDSDNTSEYGSNLMICNECERHFAASEYDFRPKQIRVKKTYRPEKDEDSNS